MGMVFAAQNMLRETEADPLTKNAFDQYTAGVNHFIENLSTAICPLNINYSAIVPKSGQI